MTVDGVVVTPTIERIGISRYASIALERLNATIAVTWP
jgi:hypothetical protein